MLRWDRTACNKQVDCDVRLLNTSPMNIGHASISAWGDLLVQL